MVVGLLLIAAGLWLSGLVLRGDDRPASTSVADSAADDDVEPSPAPSPSGPVPFVATDNDSLAPPDPLLAAAGWHRTATLTINVRTTDRYAYETWTYRLALAPGDPLAAALLTGEVGPADVLTYVLGAVQIDIFGPPAFERAGPDSPLIAVFTVADSRYPLQDYAGQGESAEHTDTITLFAPARTAPGDPLPRYAVVALTAEVRCDDCRIIRILGRLPVRQSPTSVSFSGPPSDSQIVMHSVVAPATTAPSGDDSDDPDSDDAGSFDSSFVFFPLTSMLPLLLLLAGAPRRLRARNRLSLAAGALIVATAATSAILDGAGVLAEPAYRLLFATLTVAAPAVFRWRLPHVYPGFRPPRGSLAFVVGIAGALATTEIVWRYVDGGDVLPRIGSLAAVLALALGSCCLARAAGRKWATATIVAVAVGCTAAWMGADVPEELEFGTLAYATVGFSWIPTVLQLASAAVGARVGAPARIVLAATSATLFVPVILLVVRPDRAVGYVGRSDSVLLATYATLTANIAVAALLCAVLARLGSGPSVPATRMSRAAAVAVVAVVVVPTEWGTLRALAVAVVAVLSFAWLLPARRVALGARLGRISAPAHRRLLLAESWRRAVHTATLAHYKAAEKEIAGSPRTRSEKERDQSSLDEPQDPDRGRRLSAAALGSYAGLTPARSGRYGAQLGLLLGAPMICYELYLYARGLPTLPQQWGIDLIDAVRYAARWVAFGFLFGYFYPYLRGVTPMAKCGALMLALLAPEAVDVLPRVPAEGALTVVAVGGQLVVFSLGMGLLWELHLVHAAGLAWARIRDFRQVRAIGAPLTAVIVTIVTTAATAVVGAAAAQNLDNAPNPVVTGRPTPNATTGPPK